MKYSPGKKRKLSKEQEAKLVDIVANHTPEEVGFKNRCNWTIALVQEYIQKTFNVKMCGVFVSFELFCMTIIVASSLSNNNI